MNTAGHSLCHTMRRLLLLSLLHFTVLSLLAIPAQPGKKRITMTDGTTREVVIRGDERCHWIETPQGQRIGERTISQLALTAPPPRCNTPHASPRKAQAASGELLLEGSFPTRGKHKLLALLINYANTTPTYSEEQFKAMLNGSNTYRGTSFRDYYLDQSNGQLDIETTVTPWITVGQAKQYYNLDNTPSLIAEALKQIDATIDFRDFDNDHDGILDGLIVIHAGHGQEASADPTDIWSHSSTIYGMQFDGVSIYRYTIEPECLHDGPSTIGVFCHEFGHNLGALDYYDTNYSSDGAYGGTGPWDLMGEGAWNGPSGEGDYPAPFTAWQKWQFGWITPEELSQSQHLDDVEPSHRHGRAFRMNTTTEGDYFVLENVQNDTPWTRYLPGHGLVITHVVEDIFRQRMAMNNVNHTFPQSLYTVCADAHTDPVAGQPSSYGDLTSSATPFPGSKGHDAFSDATLPSTHSQDGRFGYIALQNIRETQGLLSFDFILGDAPQRPLHLTATVQRGSVELSWDFTSSLQPLPSPLQSPVRCDVYRNALHIGTVESPTAQGWHFVDPEAGTAGLVRYTVDATYDSGLTSAVSSVSTRIPQQMAADLTATLRTTTSPQSLPSHLLPLNSSSPSFGEENGGEEIFLDVSWTIPTVLTRCTDDLHYQLVGHMASTFCYAHRFRADDLQPFVGRQIRSISFIPQQRSTDAAYKVCVWRQQTTEPELIAERTVSEFSPSYQRSVALLSRPTIEAGYDYLIGVQITSTNGYAEAVSDQAELQNGYGNLMSINGGAWQVDPMARGNYILSATLAADTSTDPDATRTIIYNAFPDDPDAPTLFGSYQQPFDFEADLFFPLGFTLYADGLRVAETTGHSLTLPLDFLAYTSPSSSPSDFGLVSECRAERRTTTLSLTSTYKAGNHSRTIDIELPLGSLDAIGSTTLSTPTSSFLPLYDLQGRVLHSPSPTAPASHGVYIVGGRKVIR